MRARMHGRRKGGAGFRNSARVHEVLPTERLGEKTVKLLYMQLGATVKERPSKLQQRCKGKFSLNENDAFTPVPRVQERKRATFWI